MANNIGAISGGGSGYGVNWNNNRANNNEVDKNEAQEQKQASAQQNKTLNPDDVLQFLTNNNYFMPASVDEASEASQARTVDPDMAEKPSRNTAPGSWRLRSPSSVAGACGSGRCS